MWPQAKTAKGWKGCSSGLVQPCLSCAVWLWINHLGCTFSCSKHGCTHDVSNDYSSFLMNIILGKLKHYTKSSVHIFIIWGICICEDIITTNCSSHQFLRLLSVKQLCYGIEEIEVVPPKAKEVRIKVMSLWVAKPKMPSDLYCCEVGFLNKMFPQFCILILLRVLIYC